MKVSKQDVEEFRDRIIRLHDRIIKLTGGEPGIRDIGGLEHAAYEILSSLDKTHFYVSAKIYRLLATRHYFVDGNKRTAHILSKLLLLVENYRLKLRYKDAAKFIIEIADKEKTIDEIKEWIKDNVESVDLDKYVDDLEEEIREMKEYQEKSKN